MKRIKNTELILLCLCCGLLFSACKNREKRMDDGFRFEENMKLSDIEVTKSFVYLFPAPGEVLDRFYNADLQYIENLLHDPGKSDTYLTVKEKGLNLGIYITDMAYCALFSRNSEATDYLEVIRKLTSDLNVSTTVFESLIDRARNNIGQRDSLVTISNEVFYNMVEFLEESGQENAIAIISSGAYIESLFLALNSVEEFDQDDPIIRQISEMKYPMENLMGHAESASDDPNVQSILKFIIGLNNLFSELESTALNTVVSEPGVILFSGGDSPDLNQDNFDEMKQMVLLIRENIISNNLESK
ncbi:MAG: hypothetical protein WD577_01125 [Bacteroidales bacterium]